MSQLDSSQPAATQPVEPKKSSPVRLIVLLSVLAIVLTGFMVDMFWMYDSVDAAAQRLQAAADEMAGRPREEGKDQRLTREDVAQAIGFQPTTSKVEGDRLIEHYRWWGPLPLQRRFIMVDYSDAEGKAYNSYEISNPDIFGKDIDPDAIKLDQQQQQQQQPPTGPIQPPAGDAPAGLPTPMGPPAPSVNDPAGKEESKTPDSKESPPVPEAAGDSPGKPDNSEE